MRNVTSIFVFTVLAVVPVAQAQDPSTETVAGPTVVQEDYAPYRLGYHASTLQEGFARGFADVVRSRGQFNLSTAEAKVAIAEARRREIENLEKWADAYYETRKRIRDYRASLRRPKASAEDLARYARRAAPDRLSPSELDTITGDLAWPGLLQHTAFNEHRATLEELFEQRAVEGELNGDAHLSLLAAIDAMGSELKDRVREVPLQQYADAKRFLKSLDYEAQLSMGGQSKLAGRFAHVPRP